MFAIISLGLLFNVSRDVVPNSTLTVERRFTRFHTPPLPFMIPNYVCPISTSRVEFVELTGSRDNFQGGRNGKYFYPTTTSITSGGCPVWVDFDLELFGEGYGASTWFDQGMIALYTGNTFIGDHLGEQVIPNYWYTVDGIFVHPVHRHYEYAPMHSDPAYRCCLPLTGWYETSNPAGTTATSLNLKAFMSLISSPSPPLPPPAPSPPHPSPPPP